MEYLSSPGYRCNRCARDEHYYSLYEFSLNYGEYHFCFHLPYVLGRKWLTSVEISEKEAKIEHEGYFVFGRPIQESEALAVELFEVVAEIEEFLANTEEGRSAIKEI